MTPYEEAGIPKPKPGTCGKAAPAWWNEPEQFCVLPENHKIEFHTNGAGEKLVLKGHESQSGRKWPTGKHNMEDL